MNNAKKSEVVTIDKDYQSIRSVVNSKNQQARREARRKAERNTYMAIRFLTDFGLIALGFILGVILA